MNVATFAQQSRQIYLAAPWFSSSQIDRYDRVLPILRDWQARQDNRQVYIPRDLICPPDAESETRQWFYDSNLEAIRESEIVVAITDDRDMGTIYELGYAAALRDAQSSRTKALVGVALDLNDSPFNLMLAVGLDVVCTSIEHLSSYLLEGVVRKYEGRIE